MTFRRLALAGAGFWIVGVVLEHGTNAFPPATDPLAVAVQLLFLAASTGWALAFAALARGSTGLLRAGAAVVAVGHVVFALNSAANLTPRELPLPLLLAGVAGLGLGGLFAGVVALVRRIPGVAVVALGYPVLMFLAPPLLLGRVEPGWPLELAWGVCTAIGAALTRTGTCGRPTSRVGAVS